MITRLAVFALTAITQLSAGVILSSGVQPDYDAQFNYSVSTVLSQSLLNQEFPQDDYVEQLPGLIGYLNPTNPSQMIVWTTLVVTPVEPVSPGNRIIEAGPIETIALPVPTRETPSTDVPAPVPPDPVVVQLPPVVVAADDPVATKSHVSRRRHQQQPASCDTTAMATPEPGSLWLIGTGLLAIGGSRIARYFFPATTV